MSTNHLSFDIPETKPWLTHQSFPFPTPMEPIQNQNSSSSGSPIQLYHHYQQTSSSCLNSHSTNSRFNLNHDDNEDDDNVVQAVAVNIDDQDEKEPMFEKPLTPSDVGKLNRLVIPKQHAEKYFPLGDSGESRGLLLSFEDESGKCWRFRYSYWNSSQSYVLTKGWSRYVKDKRLDAGDVVLFERHRVDSQRLFLNWRRRQQSGTTSAQVSRAASGDGNNGAGVGWTRHFYAAHPYPTHHQPLTYQPECLHADDRVFQRTSPVGNSSRVLRLFGVNMECQEPDESVSGSSRSEYSYLSSTQEQGIPTHQYFYYQQASYSPNPHTHTVHQLPFW